MTVIVLNQDKKNKIGSLQNLWIIERKSGICIFEKNFNDHKKIPFSNNLICGFLSAISMLALEAFAENVTSIKLSRIELYFKNTRNFLFIFSIQNQNPFSSYKIKNLISEISDMFIEIYDKGFENWDKDIRQFKNFSSYLESKIY
jgi:hypothetical protein